MIVIDTALSLVSNAIGAFKEFIGFQSKKLDLKNTASVQEAAKIQNATTQKDEIAKAIREKNIEEVRRHLAE